MQITFEQFLKIANNSGKQETLKFLDNCLKTIRGENVQMTFRSPKFDLEIDSTERQQRNQRYKQVYAQQLVQMGFKQQQIDAVLQKYQPADLPCFDVVLNQVMLQPKIRMLDQSDFANLNSDFSESAKPQPTQIQQKILDNLFLLSPPAQALVVVATGLGKTFLSIFAVEHFLEDSDCVLFLVNSQFIKDQACAAYKKYFQLADADICNVGDTVQVQKQRFVFCLFQSLPGLPDSLKARVSILVVDEVHHVMAPTFRQSFQSFNHLKLKLGLTATLTHQDDVSGAEISQMFGNNVVCNLPWTVAKQLGLFPNVSYLEFQGSPGYVFRFNSKYEDTKRAVLQSKDFSKFQLEFSLSVQEMAQTLVKFLLNNDVKKIIVFLSTVREVEIFSGSFQFDDYSLLQAHYQVERNQLQSNMSRFHAEDHSILVTVGMATEGYDMPDVDCVLMGRQTDSERLFVQQMGRCLRKHAGKEKVFVLDMCGNLRQRWMRLQEQEGTQSVVQQMCEFWEVRGVE